ncbi:unnamed protein product [Chondrus crispus]|uniref:Myb-like domain-containing protein n=1 Tax=Chondrus crispus TaxID=2769 RepID=R7Q9I2_CHOCR|nr:unnamed protein product [Chondrus crispus]CDF34135.1 unnamed protein product [Chondrus crispus]|eukprot:XP_005713954.1 unnamed protein product [Chondrus crispus]
MPPPSPPMPIPLRKRSTPNPSHPDIPWTPAEDVALLSCVRQRTVLGVTLWASVARSMARSGFVRPKHLAACRKRARFLEHGEETAVSSDVCERREGRKQDTSCSDLTSKRRRVDSNRKEERSPISVSSPVGDGVAPQQQGIRDRIGSEIDSPPSHEQQSPPVLTSPYNATPEERTKGESFVSTAEARGNGGRQVGSGTVVEQRSEHQNVDVVREGFDQGRSRLVGGGVKELSGRVLWGAGASVVSREGPEDRLQVHKTDSEGSGSGKITPKSVFPRLVARRCMYTPRSGGIDRAPRLRWSKQEDALMLDYMSSLSPSIPLVWEDVSRYMEAEGYGRNAAACAVRARRITSSINPAETPARLPNRSTPRRSWTADEEYALLSCLARKEFDGGDWNDVTKWMTACGFQRSSSACLQRMTRVKGNAKALGISWVELLTRHHAPRPVEDVGRGEPRSDVQDIKSSRDSGLESRGMPQNGSSTNKHQEIGERPPAALRTPPEQRSPVPGLKKSSCSLKKQLETEEKPRSLEVPLSAVSTQPELQSPLAGLRRSSSALEEKREIVRNGKEKAFDMRGNRDGGRARASNKENVEKPLSAPVRPRTLSTACSEATRNKIANQRLEVTSSRGCIPNRPWTEAEDRKLVECIQDRERINGDWANVSIWMHVKSFPRSIVACKERAAALKARADGTFVKSQKKETNGENRSPAEKEHSRGIGENSDVLAAEASRHGLEGQQGYTEDSSFQERIHGNARLGAMDGIIKTNPFQISIPVHNFKEMKKRAGGRAEPGNILVRTTACQDDFKNMDHVKSETRHEKREQCESNIAKSDQEESSKARALDEEKKDAKVSFQKKTAGQRSNLQQGKNAHTASCSHTRIAKPQMGATRKSMDWSPQWPSSREPGNIAHAVSGKKDVIFGSELDQGKDHATNGLKKSETSQYKRPRSFAVRETMEWPQEGSQGHEARDRAKSDSGKENTHQGSELEHEKDAATEALRKGNIANHKQLKAIAIRKTIEWLQERPSNHEIGDKTHVEYEGQPTKLKRETPAETEISGEGLSKTAIAKPTRLQTKRVRKAFEWPKQQTQKESARIAKHEKFSRLRTCQGDHQKKRLEPPSSSQNELLRWERDVCDSDRCLPGSGQQETITSPSRQSFGELARRSDTQLRDGEEIFNGDSVLVKLRRRLPDEKNMRMVRALAIRRGVPIRPQRDDVGNPHSASTPRESHLFPAPPVETGPPHLRNEEERKSPSRGSGPRRIARSRISANTRVSGAPRPWLTDEDQALLRLIAKRSVTGGSWGDVVLWFEEKGYSRTERAVQQRAKKLERETEGAGQVWVDFLRDVHDGITTRKRTSLGKGFDRTLTGYEDDQLENSWYLSLSESEGSMMDCEPIAPLGDM